jgi:hypothetical protein
MTDTVDRLISKIVRSIDHFIKEFYKRTHHTVGEASYNRYFHCVRKS